jgi:hypothetical protein
VGQVQFIVGQVKWLAPLAHGQVLKKSICLPLNVFICFASFENPKTYQPARKKNKQEKITKSLEIF